MEYPNGVEHNPMEDMLVHFVCEQWARKLAATPVEHFSAQEYTAFESHKQTCSRCRTLEQQYKVVDAYLYDVLFEDYVSLPAHMPSLPWWLRLGYYGRTIWEGICRSSDIIQRIASLILQITGVILLCIILWQKFTQVSIIPIVQIPAHLGTLLCIAMLCIVLGQLYIVHVQRQSLYTIATHSYAPGRLGSGQSISNRRTVQRTSGNSARSIYGAPSGLYLDAERQKISASEHPLSSLAQDIPSTIPQTRRHVLWRERWIWGVTAFLLVAIGFTSLEWFPSLSHERTAKGTPASGAPVGISVNGSTVFDTNRPDGALKLQAAKQVSANNMAGAQILWQQALALESNDAEVQIYQENQVVMLSHHPYMTLVVGVIFSQQHVGGARDILQGAYVKQKEYNDVMLKQPQGVLLRLMIASADVDSLSPQMVAQKIVQAAQQDPTIVGVVGWSTSASTESALPVLTAAHIPLISPTASSDDLSGKSPYFFRVAPTDQQQAIVAAQYVSDTLHAKHVALFVDSNDSYSNSLASAFKGALQGTDGKVVTNTYTYVKGDPNTIDVQMNTVLQQQPDLIYFAGYVDDVSVVLSHLTACQNHQQCLLVMGGDALYVQGNYSLQDFKNYDHLLFTSFAFQPQDQIRHPQFFTDYARFFDPKGLYRAGTYGYNATDADAILSYDATSVFVQAREQLATQQRTSHLTIQAMQQVLHTLHVDGVSGSISFDQDGNPVHKGVVILKGSANGKTVLASQN